MAEQAGFQAAFLNFGGGLGTDLPPYALPRMHVTAGMSLGEFEAHVSGFYARLQRVVAPRHARCGCEVRLEMTGRSAATNLQIYDAPEVAAHYAALDYLTPCERVLFEDLHSGGQRDSGSWRRRRTHYVLSCEPGFALCRRRLCPRDGQGLPSKVSGPGISVSPMRQTCRFFRTLRSTLSCSRSTASTMYFRSKPDEAVSRMFAAFLRLKVSLFSLRTMRGQCWYGRSGTGSGCSVLRGDSRRIRRFCTGYG